MQFNAYSGLDVHKETIVIAIAEAGRKAEVHFHGEIANTPDAVARMLKKLGSRYGKLHFVYEAGPCGYGLYRQINAAGQVCEVVSPAHTPRRAGDRVKTDRRDAVTLARLSRAGELTSVWVPDEAHEAMRDLIRAREAATKDVRQARQRIQSFLLRHGRRYAGAVWKRSTVSGLPIRASPIPHSRSPSKLTSMPWIRRSNARISSRSKSRRSCRNGRLVPSSRRSRHCAAYGCGRDRRRNRRHAAFRQSPPADGFSRPRPRRTLEWQQTQTDRHHQQPRRAPAHR